MVILGVDPGTNRVGYGIIKKTNHILEPVEFGCVEIQSGLDSNQNLKEIYDSVCNIIIRHNPDVLVIEKLFFFKNAKTITRVSEARGVIILAGLKNNLAIMEFTPLQVKQAVSAYGRADKSAVQKMVKIILGLEKEPKPDDTADALAIAICCANTAVFEP